LLLAQDWRAGVPEDHLANFVVDLVATLDLSAFYAPYETPGAIQRSFLLSLFLCSLESLGPVTE
jgi:hypothetical protein